MGTKQIHSAAGGESALTKSRISPLPVREDELRAPVEKLFLAEGYSCKAEVRFGLKRIDLLFCPRPNGQEIVTVELKLRNWKKAIWQAVSNRQVATYSYVALPSRIAAVVDRRLMASLGLGLIVANPTGEAKIALPAKRSRHVNKRIAAEIAILLANY